MEPTALPDHPLPSKKEAVLSAREKAARRRRRVIKSSLAPAFDAHEQAMNSKSRIAMFNSICLRDLEVAFAKDPECDLLSMLHPDNYKSAMKEFRDPKASGADGEYSSYRTSRHVVELTISRHADSSNPIGPPAKRVQPAMNSTRPSGQDQSMAPFGLPTVPDEVTIKALLAPAVSDFFAGDCSPQNIRDTLDRCDTLFSSVFGGRKILKLNDSIAVKIIPIESGTREYTALEYLDKNCTGVPAPKPLGMCEMDRRLLMFMSYIPGQTLEKIWPSLDQEQKVAVSVELNSILSILRSHSPPSDQPWGGLGGEGCLDQRRGIRRSTEVIRHPHDFESFYFSKPKWGSSVWIAFLRQLYRAADYDDGSQDCCVLTHGDLRQANIMVQHQQDRGIIITGIVDWEYCGIYPAYWEAIKLTNCMGAHEQTDWFQHLPPIISPQTYAKRWLLDRVWYNHVIDSR